MSFRTTEHIELELPKMQKILNFENEPKWYTLRFAIFISLSIEKHIPLNLEDEIDFTNGIGYKADVITGRNKTEIKGTQGDYTDMIAVMISNVHDCKLKDINSLDKYLERHCVRGFNYLEKSLNSKSSVFVWLKNEFNL